MLIIVKSVHGKRQYLVIAQRYKPEDIHIFITSLNKIKKNSKLKCSIFLVVWQYI